MVVSTIGRGLGLDRGGLDRAGMPGKQRMAGNVPMGGGLAMMAVAVGEAGDELERERQKERVLAGGVVARAVQRREVNGGSFGFVAE